MAKKFGGIWVVYDDLDVNRIDYRLLGRTGTINLFLPTSYLSPGTSCLSLLSSTSETIDYISIATAGKGRGDMERKVVFGPALTPIKPIKIEHLKSELPKKYAQYVIPPTRRCATIPPGTWKEIIDCLCINGWVKNDDLQYLKNLISSRKSDRIGSLTEVLQYERDAVAVSLDTFGGSTYRQKYLSASPASSDAPFIKALEKSGVEVLEDRMIEHDISTFPGAKAILRYFVGAVKIETESGALTIVNANRSGIEHTLGVDLVYYNHVFDSFVLVQYKRLTGENRPVYRPNSDSSYKEEIKRMNAFKEKWTLSKNSNSYHEYRLQDDPFFFKLCNSSQPGHWSGQMLSGMYFPLELWERFIKTDAAKGVRGGVIIGWENANRRFNNTEFTRLVKGGWIGSSGNQSKYLNQILETELSKGKSVIAAIQTAERVNEDYLRDVHGRFASMNDPDAL